MRCGERRSFAENRGNRSAAQKTAFLIGWEQVNLFSKRVISTFLNEGEIPSYELNDTDLLAARDILDKQIVDVNGVRLSGRTISSLKGMKGTRCSLPLMSVCAVSFAVSALSAAVKGCSRPSIPTFPTI
jgi:hypothetical protein